MVVGVVALIVIGPKDLPGMFRTLGEFTGKARRMAREFSRAMEQAADESGVNDINKTIRAATNPVKFGTDAIRDSVASSLKPGDDESTLSDEHKAEKAKIDASMRKAANERMERERAAEAAAAAEARKPVAKKASAKKAPAKKTTIKAKQKAKAKPKADT